MRKRLCLSALILALVAVPAWAQHRSAAGDRHASSAAITAPNQEPKPERTRMSTLRSNKGGKVRGRERAEQVQALNAKADTKRGFTVAPGVEKAEGKTPAKTQGRRAPQKKH